MSLVVDVVSTRRSRYVSILALVAGLILIGGWLARPRDITQNQAPVPSETELEQLARRTERRALDSTSAFFAGLARDVSPSVAYVRIAQATGIVWDEARILTTALRSRPARAAGAPAALHTVDGQLGIWGPNLVFSAVRFDPKVELIPAQRAPSVPRPGEWLVAVWRNNSSPGICGGEFSRNDVHDVRRDNGRRNRDELRVRESDLTASLAS